MLGYNGIFLRGGLKLQDQLLHKCYQNLWNCFCKQFKTDFWVFIIWIFCGSPLCICYLNPKYTFGANLVNIGPEV